MTWARAWRPVLALLFALSATTPAAAQTPESLLRSARRAEARADPKRAAELYEALIDRSPQSRLARDAGRRLGWLQARSEGDYATLAAVERMRRRRGELNLAAVRELERALDRTPPGLARREGWALVAESYLALEDGEGAESAFARLEEEPEVAPEQRRHAISGGARALLLEGRPAEAWRRLEEAELQATALGERVAQARRTQIGRRICLTWLGLFLLLNLALGRTRLLRLATWRRALSRGRRLAGLYVVGAPILIATLFDEAAFDTFAWLALGSALVLALTSATGVCLAPDARRPRMLLAAGAALAELSVAYIVLAELGEVLSFGA
ncbi:MAG: hypothetical protein GXP55_23810 [Deltaproteobacteria bacterium]|nr:hypothetical protein [Deltaproteobacteria bacterium]